MKTGPAGTLKPFDRTMVQAGQGVFVEHFSGRTGAPFALSEEHHDMAAIPGGKIDVMECGES